MCVLHGVRGILAREIRGLQKDPGFSKVFSTQVTITWRNLHKAQMGDPGQKGMPCRKKKKNRRLGCAGASPINHL